MTKGEAMNEEQSVNNKKRVDESVVTPPGASRNNIAWRLGQLERMHTYTQRCLEDLNTRLVVRETSISAENVYKTVEAVRINSLAIEHLQDAIDEFKKQNDRFHHDRVKRLDDTNEEIDRLRDTIKENKIRTQQYFITVVVGMLVTVFLSLLSGYLRL